MLASTAERVYWLGRFIERAENTARLILVRHQLVLDLPKHVQPQWDLLLQVMGVEERFAKRHTAVNEKNIISFVFGERNNPSSIISSLSSARENMRTAREIMPSEAWEQTNSLYLRVARRSLKGLPRGSRHTVLNNIVQSCQQITGMLAGTMNHDAAYQFIRIGRNLERADMSTRIVDAASAGLTGSEEEASPYQNVLWISVLQSLSAYQMYRLTVQRQVNPQDVLAFLFLSEEFPRAVTHCLGELENGMTPLTEQQPALREIKRVRRRVKAMDYQSLEGPVLSEFVHKVQVDLEALHNVIGLTWFSSEGA